MIPTRNPRDPKTGQFQPKPKGRSSARLKPLDAITIVAIPLAVVGVISENTPLVVGCFVGCVILLTFAVARHEDLSKILRFSICSSIVIGFGCAGIVIVNKNYENELSKNEGVLEPANDPMPARYPNSSCNSGPRDMTVFLGNTVSVATDKTENTIIQLNNATILSLNTVNNKLIINHLELYDSNNESIAHIHEDGKFWVMPNIHKVRRDKSTLVVYDKSDNVVLEIRFLRFNAIYVTGVFKMNGISLYVLSDKILVLPVRGTIDHVCADASDGKGHAIDLGNGSFLF